ncbi:MAG: nuclear transport factor 2 family protein [Frankiaceae bacterium]|nr:nuclear transport factor 2 family protein [Frankiaceae bacterium]
MLSLQEISDRMEITDLLARYSAAIDGRAWDDLDVLFTDDALIDYSEMGGISGSLAEQKAFLASVMPSFANFQHLTATSTFDIDGDTARVRTICFNPMVVTDERQVLFCGLWYRDVLVRTPDGWRIRERHEDRGWSLDVRA